MPTHMLRHLLHSYLPPSYMSELLKLPVPPPSCLQIQAPSSRCYMIAMLHATLEHLPEVRQFVAHSAFLPYAYASICCSAR